MAVKATLRKPTETATRPANLTVRERAGAIDVESKVVDGRDELASQLGGEESTETTATAVATRPKNAVARAWSGGGFDGDWDDSDTKLPQIKIVNGSGDLSKTFNQGTLIYSDEKLWNPPSLDKGVKNPEMLFVPMRIEKQFRENLTQEEQGDGVMPRVVSSREEAERLTGEGSTQWVGGEKPKWSPSGKCILALQAPEGCEHPGFCTPLDGKTWALAVYYCGGMAYNHFVKVIRSAAPLSLREPGSLDPVLHKKLWTWEVVKTTAGKFTIFVPKIRLTRAESGPELRAFAESLKGKTVQTEE